MSDSRNQPAFPGPGELPPLTGDDVLASDDYVEILACLPEAARPPAAEYLAAIAGIPDILNEFAANTYGESLNDEIGATDAEIHAGAATDLGVVVAGLHNWYDAINALSLAFAPPQPEDLTEFLSRQIAAFYAELVRQRTQITAWCLRGIGLPDAPRPLTTGTSMCTSNGYIEIGNYLNLPT